MNCKKCKQSVNTSTNSVYQIGNSMVCPKCVHEWSSIRDEAWDLWMHGRKNVYRGLNSAKMGEAGILDTGFQQAYDRSLRT